MICIDANVILDVALERTHEADCKAFISSTRQNGEKLAITTLTLDLAMYYVERHKIDRGWAKRYLELFTWLAVTETDGLWAFGNYGGKDFEDALQIGCAIREQCSAFATLDKELAKKYKAHLPVKLIAPN